MLLTRLRSLLALLIHDPRPPIFYDPLYRLPFANIEPRLGIEPRRADFAAWYLHDARALAWRMLRAPRPVTFEQLARVHGHDYLEGLSDPQTLARVFGVDPSEIDVDEVLGTVRLATGGTVEATVLALEREVAVLNLLGGFHHAFPNKGGGLCPVNDLAVGLAEARARGFRGRAVVLDLDAHPPDGTAACLATDAGSWIGSLSGSDWGPLPGVDETVLPEGSGDAPYLAALEGLLGRMPAPDLAFVIAGGDVLANDRMGLLGLTLDGARRRDLAVARALEGVPSVWVPGGGYSRRGWRVLAGTGLVLSWRSLRPIPEDYDPLEAEFNRIFRKLRGEDLGASSDTVFTAEDFELDLGVAPPGRPRLFGLYTPDGVEHGLERYGILPHLRRLGYDEFRVAFDSTDAGERIRLFGRHDAVEHRLIEVVLAKQQRPEGGRLFLNWLSLEDPRARFGPLRPRLPGQDNPGLGLSREIVAVLERMARRLGLQTLVYRPAYFHTAYAARRHFRFEDPARQGRFEALVRDLHELPLVAATTAVAEGRVLLDGAPYAWEATEMVHFLLAQPPDAPEIAAARERYHFDITKE